MWRFFGLLGFCASLIAQEGETSKSVPAAAEPAAETISTNAAYKIPENRILHFTVPLTREGKLALAAKNQVVDFAKVAVAVPFLKAHARL